MKYVHRAAPVLGLLCLLSGLLICGLWLVRYPRHVPPMLPTTERADAIIVHKAERRLDLIKNGAVWRSYRIALGFAPTGHKRREGDGKTPEGRYVIEARNPRSAYHLSLRVSYPSARDRARADARGEPPGGDIMIHGLPNGTPFLGKLHAMKDWTAGCIAVTNEEIRQIWAAVGDGTTITIHP